MKPRDDEQFVESFTLYYQRRQKINAYYRFTRPSRNSPCAHGYNTINCMRRSQIFREIRSPKTEIIIFKVYGGAVCACARGPGGRHTPAAAASRPAGRSDRLLRDLLRPPNRAVRPTEPGRACLLRPQRPSRSIKTVKILIILFPCARVFFFHFSIFRVRNTYDTA